MSNITYRIFLEKLGGTSADDFIGKLGDVFYDPETGNLRISDGETPGGIDISSGGGSSDGIKTIKPGLGISVDDTDKKNPIVSANIVWDDVGGKPDVADVDYVDNARKQIIPQLITSNISVDADGSKGQALVYTGSSDITITLDASLEVGDTGSIIHNGTGAITIASAQALILLEGTAPTLSESGSVAQWIKLDANSISLFGSLDRE